MRNKLVLGTAVVGLVFIVPHPLRADVMSIDILPANQTVALGSPVTVSLEIAGFGNLVAPSLGTFDINVAFDPAILSFSGATFGDPVLGDLLDPTGSGNTIAFSTPGFGTVELFDLSLASASDLNTLQPGTFVLGTLSFNSIGTGTTALDIGVNAFGDADGNSLVVGIQNGSASISPTSPVPEPSSFVLLATVFAALTIVRVRRKRA